MAQKRSFDTIEFINGGEIWQLITYEDDSIMLNGNIFRFAGTSSVNHWQPAGTGKIQPYPSTAKIIYPGIDTVNVLGLSSTFKPLYWRADTKEIIVINPHSGIWLGQVDTIITIHPMNILSINDTIITVYMDSIANFLNPVTIKNEATNSSIIVKSLEGIHIAGSDSIIIKDKEWVMIYPATTEFVTNGNTLVIDTLKYYTKIEADAEFIKGTSRDSLYRYSVYNNGNNNIEVLATKQGITASLANGNEFTFTIPADTDIISAKIRVENFSSVICIMGGKLQAASMATRWMPVTQAWREDTGQLLTGQTTRMSLTSFSSFTINGLINYTRCHVRITF